MKHFAEFSTEEKPLDGDKIRIDEVLNCELIVCAYKIGKSKFNDNKGMYVTLQIKLMNDDMPRVIFTGSDVIAEQCRKYDNNIPFIATIKKINKYYTFT